MTAIARLEPMAAELAIAKTPQDCATLEAKAKAVATWARHIGLSLTELNRIARFRIDCMRKAGALLAGAGVGRGVKSLTLSDLNIEKNQSTRWQALARLHDDVVESYCHGCESAGSEITQAGLFKLIADERKAAKREAAMADVDAPDLVDGDIDNIVTACQDSAQKFACIYADPPWRYGNQATRAATDNHYPTMSVEEICALPIKDIAADNAHLHLWTTNAFLFDAQKVMEAWGFTYKSCFIWVKPQMGIGNYWRVSHEFLLLGIRGDAPFLEHDEMSWAQLPRGEHSAKPYAIRRTIERVSPGPRIELFARQEYEGWSAWGNQIQRNSTRLFPQ